MDDREKAVLDLLCCHLQQLSQTVFNMYALYEQNDWLNDKVDIQEIVAMSLDEWHLEINTKINELREM